MMIIMKKWVTILRLSFCKFDEILSGRSVGVNINIFIFILLGRQ